MQLLCSSDKYYVSFWLKRCRGAFREWLVRSNPRERSKKERCWLAFLQRCGAESWTEVRCYFSMRCVLFPQCLFVWPIGSNKTLEEVPSSCCTNDFALLFHLCPPLACKIIKSRSGLAFRQTKCMKIERGVCLWKKGTAPPRNYCKNHLMTICKYGVVQ